MIKNITRFETEFQEIYKKKITQPIRIFHQIKKLFNTERGLSFQIIKKLYITYITLITNYGVPIWWNN